MKPNIGKRQYIRAAQRVLAAEGAGSLTIRRLGRELDCNPANLYRYFGSLDELRVYASLGCLRDYLRDLEKMFAAQPDPMARYFGVWECFARHAFAHADIFDQLFFHPGHQELEQIIRSYYALFPDEVEAMGELRHVFIQGDFDLRDYLFLEELARGGYIAAADAAVLNKISVNLFRGCFKQVLDRNYDQAGQEREKEQFLTLLRFVFAGRLLK
ncbi:MAG: TetR/AcrR family transcriptional regulator [Bacillota bacterium]|nr:TetR/AcrR family transcriptional regulator [Bacillota bacterium]